MKESYSEGLANRAGPESCVGARKGAGEALTGVHAGRAWSREIHEPLWEADAVENGGRQHQEDRHRKALLAPTRSETPNMCGNLLQGNREIPGLFQGDPPSGWPPLPKAGAGCGNSASPDLWRELWRGLWVTIIPTPTREQRAGAIGRARCVIHPPLL